MMEICSHCVLPATFPGIRFDKEGKCNFCQDTILKQERQKEQTSRYRERFSALATEIKQSGRFAHRPYDLLLAYSGGKDSSYALKLLTGDFHLRVLAITFNHGLLSSGALENIHKVTEALRTDHVMVTPNQMMLYGAFRNATHSGSYPMKSLQRASSICNVCMDLIKLTILKNAIEAQIPLIAYGWSPGQIPIRSSVMRLNKEMINQMHRSTAKHLSQVMGEDHGRFILKERHFKLLDEETKEKDRGWECYYVNPLAFVDYDEVEVVHEVESLGWKRPGDTGASSSNCLLNVFANKVHLERFGFHPYALETARLVREGYMTREDGLRRIYEPPDREILHYVEKRLGIC